jgi:hypothetical protein
VKAVEVRVLFWAPTPSRGVDSVDFIGEWRSDRAQFRSTAVMTFQRRFALAGRARPPNGSGVKSTGRSRICAMCRLRGPLRLRIGVATDNRPAKDRGATLQAVADELTVTRSRQPAAAGFSDMPRVFSTAKRTATSPPVRDPYSGRAAAGELTRTDEPPHAPRPVALRKAAAGVWPSPPAESEREFSGKLIAPLYGRRARAFRRYRAPRFC